MKYLGSKTLETDRLILKAQTMDEQHYLWSILMIPEVNKYYLSISKKYAERLKDWNIQEEFYKKDMEHANDLDVFRWSVFLKETNECIGRVSCHKSNSDDSDSDNPSIRGIGWYLDPKHHGKGYGNEAGKAMVDYMFKECEIDEIKTCVAINNPASWKILEKLGFERLDGTELIDYTYQDEPIEDYRYHITKEMWFKDR